MHLISMSLFRFHCFIKISYSDYLTHTKQERFGGTQDINL